MSNLLIIYIKIEIITFKSKFIRLFTINKKWSIRDKIQKKMHIYFLLERHSRCLHLFVDRH